MKKCDMVYWTAIVARADFIFGKGGGLLKCSIEVRAN